jgi:hypothetical protein
MSAFKNGDIVKTRTDIFGRVQAYRPELHPTQPTKNPGKSGPPGSEIDEPVRIPKGKIGEVLYSDEIDTIAMFPIHETGRLEPHLVKAQGFTKDFQRVVRDPEKHPFVQLKPRKLKNPQKPLEEPEKEIMGEIVDVSPVKKFLGKWIFSDARDYAKAHPHGDPFEWGGGEGPHGQIIQQQEDRWWEEPEDRQKLAVINALRVAIFSPMKLLKHNAVHFQDFADLDPYSADIENYLDRKKELRRKWNTPGQTDLFGENEVGTYDEEKPAFDEKYPGIINKHLEAMTKLSQYVDQLHSAAMEDLKNGGKGNIWRQALRDINVPQVNDKVASFSWLLLSPKTSDLATIDVHMSDAMDVARPTNQQEYKTYEDMMRATKNSMGYHDMPLGAFQWGLWDYYRTGPGSHQAHDAMKPLNFTPYSQIDWTPSVESKQVPPGFDEAKPLRDEILQQSGVSIKKNEKEKKKRQKEEKEKTKYENQLDLFSTWKVK